MGSRINLLLPQIALYKVKISMSVVRQAKMTVVLVERIAVWNSEIRRASVSGASVCISAKLL